HSFGDASRLEALLRDAGFREVRVRTISRTTRFDADVHFERLNARALIGMSKAGKTMSDEERMRTAEAIASESAPVLQRHAVGSGIGFEVSTNLAMAGGYAPSM